MPTDIELAVARAASRISEEAKGDQVIAQTALGDHLADLHHWADANNVDWAQAMDEHHLHYWAEVTEI